MLKMSDSVLFPTHTDPEYRPGDVHVHQHNLDPTELPPHYNNPNNAYLMHKNEEEGRGIKNVAGVGEHQSSRPIQLQKSAAVCPHGSFSQQPPASQIQVDVIGATAVPPQNNRALRDEKIGRIRRYNEQKKAYGDWEDICISKSSPSNGSIRIDLIRGGKVGIYTKMLPVDKQESLSTAMHQCKLYRQYTRSQVFEEPRFHVLLSSKAHCDRGYMYHGIKMKALPIDLVPEVARYATELARFYNLPHDQWGIGVDLIIYKDGVDSIGWHADDTQGESVVLCVVVDAPGEARPVHIRPNKRAKPLADGDEEIQLYVTEGMAYDMDGYMQDGYEHCLPKKKDGKSHRFVLIFRHGDEAAVPQDSGTAITEMATATSEADNENLLSFLSRLRVKPPLVAFGHPEGVLEGHCYSRRFLYSIGAHRADQRGVNGNVNLGSDSIVVSRQSIELREEDGLQWLRYTSSRRQGGGALVISYLQKHPVRVFRSSNLKTKFAPPELEDNRTSYRYDGLYFVTTVWDADGNPFRKESNIEIPAGGAQYTFHLERLPKLEVPSGGANDKDHNSMNVDDLWNKIQLSRGCQSMAHFGLVVPQNNGTLPRLANDVASSGRNTRGTGDQGKKSSCHITALTPLERSAIKVQPAPLDGSLWRERYHEGLLPSLPKPFQYSSVPLLTMSRQFGGYPSLQTHLSQRFMLPRASMNFQLNHPRQHPNGLLSQWINLPGQQNVPNAHSGVRFSSARNPFDQSASTAPQSYTTVDQQQLQLNCDFTNPQSIKAAFGYQRGKGKFSPTLSEIAKLKTNEEKAKYVRIWRRMTKENQERWRKCRREEKDKEKEEKKRKREELKAAKAAKKVRMTFNAKQEMKVFASSILHSVEGQLQAAEAAKKVQMTCNAKREMEVFTSSIVLMQYWENSIQVTGNAVHELETFASESVRVIVGDKMWRKKAQVKKKPAKKSLIGPNKRKALKNQSPKKKQPKVTNTRSPRKPKSQEAQQSSSHRKTAPRFITIEEGTMQSLSQPLEAICASKRKSKAMKVAVKWGIPRKQGKGSVSREKRERKRKAIEEETASGEAVEFAPRRKLPRKQSNNDANSQSKVVEPPRKIAPRFITIEEGVMQSLSQPLEALCGSRRMSKVVKVTVKWGIPVKPQKRGNGNVSSQVLEEEKISDGAVESAPTRRSPRKASSKAVHMEKEADATVKRSESEDLNKEPRVGMRVKVRFDQGEMYCGRITKVSQPKNRAFYRIKIRYDDNAEEIANYPDPDIALCPEEEATDNKNASRKKRKAPVSETAVQGPRRKSSRLSVPKVSESSLSDGQSTVKAVNETAKATQLPEASIAGENDSNHFSKRQTRAQKRGAARGVPTVGMRVKVKFDGHESYDGKITKVELKKKKQRSDQEAYNIQIHYDDGTEEDTSYPDPDIELEYR